ncbi:MAG: hypothetical protein EON59_04005 [Alphaproteobacteria bacterium]|nr:MAG: hypothetical protein EON59_04005 [Alphaproteobacteria bacterium]
MDIQIIAERFCAAPLPESAVADLVALKPMSGRTGTNLLTVAEAQKMLAPIAREIAEHAFRAGHAAAEEALGAHGSQRLLDAIERSWAGYAGDAGLPA